MLDRSLQFTWWRRRRSGAAPVTPTYQLRDSADYFRLGEPLLGAAGQSGDTALPRTLSYFRLGEPLPVAR
jgi:hypothetical protein